MDSILKTICTVESKHAAHFILFCNVFFSFSYLKCIEKIPGSIKWINRSAELVFEIVHFVYSWFFSGPVP